MQFSLLFAPQCLSMGTNRLLIACQTNDTFRNHLASSQPAIGLAELTWSGLTPHFLLQNPDAGCTSRVPKLTGSSSHFPPLVMHSGVCCPKPSSLCWLGAAPSAKQPVLLGCSQLSCDRGKRAVTFQHDEPSRPRPVIVIPRSHCCWPQ